MADRPQPDKRPRKGKINKDVLLAVLYVLFVVAAVGGMMALDYYGEVKMGRTTAVQDAPDDH